MGEPCHRLTEGDDLTGLGQRRRNHAVGIGLEIGIGELVAGEVERAPRALEAPFGFVLGRLLAIEVGDRGIAACLQRGVALESAAAWARFEVAAASSASALSTCSLRSCGSSRAITSPARTRSPTLTDARDDLPGDAKAEIGFVARPNHADEFPTAIFGLELDFRNQHWPIGLVGRGGCLISATRQQGHQRYGR